MDLRTFFADTVVKSLVDKMESIRLVYRDLSSADTVESYQPTSCDEFTVLLTRHDL
jgi:hypothetical protein